MFGKLFHRNEVEPSASSTTSNCEQGQAPPAAVPQQSFSAAAAAGPSFLANKTPRGVKLSIANSRQASQQLQQQEEEEEQQQEEEADSAEEEHEQPPVTKPARAASKKPARPSFLQQIKAAAQDPAEDQPVHIAVSAASAASMHKSAGKQQSERATATAKPWKVDKQKQQQQEQQQQAAQQQQQQLAHGQQSLVQQQQIAQRQPSQSALGLRQAEMPRGGGVAELQQQLMLEARAREVSTCCTTAHCLRHPDCTRTASAKHPAGVC